MGPTKEGAGPLLGDSVHVALGTRTAVLWLLWVLHPVPCHQYIISGTQRSSEQLPKRGAWLRCLVWSSESPALPGIFLVVRGGAVVGRARVPPTIELRKCWLSEKKGTFSITVFIEPSSSMGAVGVLAFRGLFWF